MSEENFNSEGRAADHLDALINAAQSGMDAPDETGITGFVEWSQSLRPDAAYVDDLEHHLMALHRVQRRPHQHIIRRVVLLAAALVILIAVVILVRGSDDDIPVEVVPPTGVAMSGPTSTALVPAAATPTPTTRLLPSNTPLPTASPARTQTPAALAATGTLAVEIDRTLAAADYATQNGGIQPTAVVIQMSATPTPTPTATSTAAPTLTPTASATFTSLPLATIPFTQSLDVVFVLDTTQDFATLWSGFVDGVALGGIDARFGLVAYDASGVTQITRFTSDRGTFANILVALPSGGTGHGELGAALNQALDTLSWRASPTVQVIVVIAGAPDRTGLTAAAQRAADQGVTIHVIGAGALSAGDTEVLQQVAVIGGGQYVGWGAGTALLAPVTALLAETLAGH